MSSTDVESQSKKRAREGENSENVLATAKKSKQEQEENQNSPDRLGKSKENFQKIAAEEKKFVEERWKTLPPQTRKRVLKAIFDESKEFFWDVLEESGDSKKRAQEDSSQQLANKKRVTEDPNTAFLQPQGAKRYVVFPVQHPILRNYYENQRDIFWLTKDVDCGPDRADFVEIKKEHPGIANTLLNVLAFFAASDGLILENLEQNFGEEVALIEARQFYGIQEAIEGIHSDMYSILIDRYVESIEERTRLFGAIENMPAVKAKAAWAKYWINSQHSFAERLVAMTAVEGIHFAGSFAFLFWMKDRFPGKLPGLMKSNEFISRDENLHTEFGIALYHHLPHKLPLARIREIYMSALQREMVFQKEIMPTQGISGLATERMIEHVKYTTNYWFSLFQDPRKGVPQLVATNGDGSSPQPLNEVRRISRQTKANFFEGKNSNYNQPDVTNQIVDLRLLK